MDIFKVSATALEAQRMRMNTIASNMANAQTTRTEEGGPYTRKDVVFKTIPIQSDNSEVMEGVKVVDIVEDSKPFNVKAFNISKGMYQKALEIGRF
jgi:flagellar basal-body rod protein FlgC